MHLPKTLFARTALTIAIAMLIFIIFAGGIVAYFILMPMARQGAGDLAALMVLSAQTWVELPPETRPDFEEELRLHHGLTIIHSHDPLEPITLQRPYQRYLQEALSERLGEPIELKRDARQRDLFRVEIPMANHTLRMGFSHDHIGTRPPVVMMALLLGASLMILITTLLLVRRLTLPLTRLAAATSRFARGKQPDALPEEGPAEMAALARNFNQMTAQVQQLLRNRTTLLGGISHDLRTPIARLELALELLGDKGDAELVAGMRRDLQEMNHLIGRTLELAQGMHRGEDDRRTLDIAALLATLVEEQRQQGARIEWHAATPCHVETSPLALRRVLMNLIENALRYSDHKPVEVKLRCTGDQVEIAVLDRGPGIPPEQIETVFQPFGRLDDSRSPATGGAGLGLAIVRQLCELYGWEVTLGQREGGGTRATLTLPRGGRAA